MLCQVTPEISLEDWLEAVEAASRLGVDDFALGHVVKRPEGLTLGAEATVFAMLLQGSASFEHRFGAVVACHLE